MKTIAKAKVNKSRRQASGNRRRASAPRSRRAHARQRTNADSPSGGGRIEIGAEEYPEPFLYLAEPGEDEEPQNGIIRRPMPRLAAGFTSDMRTILSVLAAHQGAVGHMTIRNRGKEVAKNELAIFVNAIIESYGNQEAVRESSELYQAALEAKMSGDTKKMIALCELRKESINNYVRARSHFLEMFFEEQVLGQNDSAYIKNETMYPQAVYYMGQDGKLRLQRAIAKQSNFLVPLYYVASQKYGYQIEDIQRGNITQPALKTVDIAWDIAQQLDRNAFLALTGGLPRAAQNGGVNGIFGSFTTNNATQQLNTYFPSPSIQQALLPTTNLLNPAPDPVPAGLTGGANGFLTDPGGNPVIGLNVAHAVLKYCDQWGNIWMDGPLRPTGLLIVPAIDASSPLSQVTATAAKPSAVAEGLLSNYTRFEYGNIVWTMMPDVTIPRGTVFGVLNKPVGKNFVKPSFDREFVNTDFENNWEDRWYRKTQGLYIPVQNTPRAVQVKYM